MSSKGTIVFVVIIIALVIGGVLLNKHSVVEHDLSYDEYLIKAREYLAENKVEKAMEAYEKALLINSTDATVHYELGTTYNMEWERTFDDAQVRHMRDTFMKKMHRGAGQDETSLKDYLLKEYEKYGLKSEYKKQAIQHFKEAVKYNPDIWQAHYFIGVDYFNTGEYEIAIKELEEVIRLNPEYNNSYEIIGESYLQMENYDLAVKYLTKAIQVDPSSEYAYYQLGKAYRRLQDGDKLHEVLAKLKAMKSTYYNRLLHEYSP
jgi:tetratricopeptide (TPR) repeat protein